ncbi:MAG: ABC transporter permease [Gammaproteobacteria bacterium]|nr:ABC transporter permease [Gammaproteobacteria bacterium]
MNNYLPSPADFLPLTTRDSADRLERPSMSYWQDVWQRLQHNRRALTSLFIVVALLLFTTIGPLVWQADPAQQDLEQISQAPNLGLRALVVDDFPEVRELAAGPVSPAQRLPPEKLLAPANLRVLGTAHSEGVHLAWDQVPGASGYQLYRHELNPSGPDDLGLPLITLRGTSLSYRDRLGLQTIEYYYSVAALSQRRQSPNYRTLAVTVGQAIRLSEASYRGLLASADSSYIGSHVQLEIHPLGTDYLGRDMLARLMWGARTSLFIGIVAPLIYVAFGLMYGGLAGYSGGHTDNFLMRFADFVIALPFLLFMILFKIAFGLGPGESGIGPMLIALVLLSWPATARLVRGQVLQIREEPYIAAARLMGASAPYLVLRHMLPNLMSVLLVSLTFAIPTAIFTEAFLSFIGMGVVPPTPSWGSMCNDGIRTMLSHPHELVFPALFISVTVLAFNLLGDGLRDAMDARMRGDS